MRGVGYVTALGFVLAACASTSTTSVAPSPGRMAVTSPVSTHDGAPSVPRETVEVSSGARVNATLDASQYAAATRDRLDEIAARLSEQIARGNLSPEALEEFNARRRVAMHLMRDAASDGIVTPHEQRAIDMIVRDAETRSYEYVPMPRAWGGGPAYWR